MIDLTLDTRHEYTTTYIMGARYYDQKCKYCGRKAAFINRYMPCLPEREALSV